MAQQPAVGQGPLIIEDLWPHSDTHKNSVTLLWKSDQPGAGTYICTIHDTHNRQTSTTLAGFEATISASERLQNHALDRAATGIGNNVHWSDKIFKP